MKKGFTLIELLAVIVILAIIALIATPIILGIINDAREESNERSVELYAAAVKNGIAAHQLTEGEVPSGTYSLTADKTSLTNGTVTFDVDYDGNVVCTTITISEDGKVSLEGCTVNGGDKEYSYPKQQEGPETAAICTPVTGDDLNYKYVFYDDDEEEFIIKSNVYNTGTKSDGDAYRCQVNNSQSYIFNIIGQDASGNYNLLLNHNLTLNGSTPGKVEDILTTLTSLTDGWTNIDKRTDSFTDSYDELDADYNSTKINYTFDYTNHYARLPEFSEIKKYAPAGSPQPWMSSVLIESTDESSWNYVSSDIHVVYKNSSGILYNGLGCDASACTGGVLGIRPVITVTPLQIG